MIGKRLWKFINLSHTVIIKLHVDLIYLYVNKWRHLLFFVYWQTIESVIALSTVLHQNKTLKALNVNRPLLFTQQEETTVHYAKMLKVSPPQKKLSLFSHARNIMQQKCILLISTFQMRLHRFGCWVEHTVDSLY